MVHVLHLLAAAVPTPVEQTAFDGNVTFGSMVRLAGSVNNTLSVYDGYTLSVIENPLTNKLEAIVGTDSGVVRTADGVTWSEVTGSVPSRRGEGGLDLATPPPFIHNFGNTQARYARKDGPITDFWGTDPIAFSIDSAGTLVDTVRTGVNVTFTGLPRPLGCSWVLNRCCTCPFRADSGNAVRLADGSLVMTMNVFLKPLITNFSGDGSSVVAYTSDAEGLAWTFSGYVAVAEDYQESGEGPNESTLSLLADGKTLMCVIRLDAGDGHVHAKPYHKSTSVDGGKTWTPLVSLPTDVGTAKPRMVLMHPTNGPLVLIGGRPGNRMWINPDGMGDEWQYIPLPHGPNVTYGGTGYNGVVALTATTGIASYDEGGSLWGVAFSLSSQA